MKRVLLRGFHVLMACVVLLSSTGFGLVEHTCQMRGTRKTVVVAFTGARTAPACTADAQPIAPNQSVIKKADCCQDNAHYENVDTGSSLSQQIAKLIKAVTETVVAGVITVLAWLADWIFDRGASSSIAASPPALSLSGRAILTLVQRLLI